MISNITHKLQVFYDYFLCSLLFVKNLLFTKKLVVNNFLYTNKIIIRGNEAELNWETTGCHKILIKDLGILTGNSSSTRIILKDKINPIKIIFFGIGGQKEIKDIVIETQLPFLVNKFDANCKKSNLTSIPFSQQNLKNILINSYHLKEPKSIKLKKTTIIPINLKAQFEPFIKSNYPIKS